MIQTLALLLDAYREMNARKMFWITLVISSLLMGAFAFVGMNGTGLTFAGMHWDLRPLEPIVIYKTFFSLFMVGIWLTWAAIVLALISTAGMFPDLITGGTIDLYLSKPLSRLRLFLTKYLTGLLFVTLQVTIFAVGSFLVFGFRAHEWKPSFFMAVPIVVCMFSYLFAFCVLLGVWLRSTVAAILLTVVFWLAFFGAQKADTGLLAMDVLLQRQLAHDRHLIASADDRLAQMSLMDKFSGKGLMLGYRRKNAVERLPDLEKNAARFHTWHRIATAINCFVPKTTETTNLLDRWLFTDEEAGETEDRRQARRRQFRENDSNSLFADDDAMQDAGVDVANATRNRSLWYIVGTSLACEAVVVALGAWIFCRRDY